MSTFKAWLKSHPWFAGLLVVVESSAFGVIVDAFSSGFDFTKGGLKHLCVIAGTAVVVAVRNYLKQSPLQAGTGTK